MFTMTVDPLAHVATALGTAAQAALAAHGLTAAEADRYAERAKERLTADGPGACLLIAKRYSDLLIEDLNSGDVDAQLRDLAVLLGASSALVDALLEHEGAKWGGIQQMLDAGAYSVVDAAKLVDAQVGR